MTLPEIERFVAKQTKVDVITVDMVVNTLLCKIATEVREGRTVKIKKFGKFQPKKKTFKAGKLFNG